MAEGLKSSFIIEMYKPKDSPRIQLRADAIVNDFTRCTWVMFYHWFKFDSVFSKDIWWIGTVTLMKQESQAKLSELCFLKSLKLCKWIHPKAFSFNVLRIRRKHSRHYRFFVSVYHGVDKENTISVIFICYNFALFICICFELVLRLLVLFHYYCCCSSKSITVYFTSTF